MLEKNKLNQKSSLQEWLDYLANIHHSAIDLGLDRVAKVAQQGNLTKPSPKIITVAGTNGKGSTCAILEAILQQAGFKTGVYSSPHLIRYNERVRINGKQLADEEHTKAFAAIEELRVSVTKTLSLFEFGTLAALWLFAQHKVDILILEVGLGGRLDATNIVEHDVSVITSLAIDHVDWLGDDIEIIGREKAGIFRAKKPAVCGQPAPPKSIASYANEIDAVLFQVGGDFSYEQQEESWSWHYGKYKLSNLPVPNLPLANAATALMAIRVSELAVSEADIVVGLKNVTLAGRMQRISTEPLILLDVAHNPHSAAYLAQQLQKLKNKSNIKINAVVGMLKDKDIKSTLAMMQPVVSKWYLASLQGERAANWQALANNLELGTYAGYASPVEAYKAAFAELESNEAIVVFGSFHTVGEIADFLS